MTFLPIVDRELRVAARRSATYWMRFSAACIGIVITGWILYMMRSEPPASLSKTLFTSLAVLAFAFSLLAGIRNTADSVSEEKREDTLGLLFLTDLRGYDVILGKLAANSLNSIYGLLAIFPVLAVPLLLGGISIDAFVRVVLLLANTLFFSLSAGIFVSTISRDSRRAISGTLSMILLVTGGLPLLGLLVAQYVQRPPSTEPHFLFLLPSPAYAFSQVLGNLAGITPSLPRFYPSLLVVHLLAWFFLLLAAIILPRCWQEKPRASASLGFRGRWRLIAHGTPAERAVLRTQLLSISPFLWVASRDRLKLILVWAFLVLTAAAWLWGYWEWRSEWFDFIVGIWTALLLHTVLKSWLASEACRHFLEHRRSGALELLLSTPLSVEEILQGHMLALRRQFGGPILVVLAIDVLLLFLGLNRGGGVSDGREITLCFLVGMVVLIIDCFALSWVGMWFGLSARNLNRATSATWARILALPWGLFILSVIIVATAGLFRTLDNTGEFGFGLALGWWFFISVTLDLLFIAWARKNLIQQFRLIASQHYTPTEKSPWWRSLWKPCPQPPPPEKWPEAADVRRL